jgi:hypothetical protein
MEPDKEIYQSKHVKFNNKSSMLQHGLEVQCQRKWNLTMEIYQPKHVTFTTESSMPRCSMGLKRSVSGNET